MGSIISAHNRQILCSVKENYGCNCKVKTDCPMQNKFLTPKVVYKTKVTNNTDEELQICYGWTKTTFKERHRNHKTSFSNKDRIKDTELLKCIWLLKDQNKTSRIKLNVTEKVNDEATLNYWKLCLFRKFMLGPKNIE